jgi:3-oxoacyl-(acyl-carrier-protein) synthase/malonyl CoA-acyl carrier protein transacylase
VGVSSKTALPSIRYPEVGALPRATTGIILGRGGYLGARGASAFQRARTAPQLMDVLRVLIPELSEARLEQVRTEFCARLEPYGPDTAIGLVPNIIASRIANRLDFQGPAYTVDAACASALVAVDHGIRELRGGRCDLVIAGGVHVVDDLSFWNVFSRLGAISRSQQIRPFDRRADGLLIGEGIGLVVLKRMSDAVRDADRAYAVIRGAGVASDGREATVMLPRVEGQLLALERAWSDAGLDPGTIGLLEAHGTGTPTGDATELATVARFFADRLTTEPGLGSVKSMIGHAMPAAGAAGLIKAALAVYHGILPPTLHCDEPHERFAATGFRLLRGREPWDSGGAPRRAGVNAFGFGGINAHVILEEAPPATEAVAPRARAEGASREEVVFLAAEQVGALQEALASGRGARSGPCRLVMSDPSRERRELAAKILARGKRWDGRNGIWFAPRGLAFDGGKVAFLCPGFDGRFEPRIGDLERHFGVSFPTVATGGSDLMGAGLGIVSLGHALDGILRNLRLRPDVVAGHSIGEWTGMWVAGMQAEAEAARFTREILPSLTLDVPGVAFAALACGLEAAQEAMSGLPEIEVSHDNCPHQTVLCGVDASIDAAIGRLRERKIFCEKLSFRSGFHSPLFAGYLEPFTENFASFNLQPATAPLWSATTVGPYPDAPDAIRQLFREHLISPVRFRELVERLYEEGVRVFVQLGVGRLPGFVRDTLHGRPHVAVAAHAENRSAMEQLRRLAMQLWCDGYELDLESLGWDPEVVRTASEGSAIPLTLSATLGTVETPLELARPSAVSDGELPKELAATAVGAELAATQRSLESMRAEIGQVWQDRRAARPAGEGEREPGVLKGRTGQGAGRARARPGRALARGGTRSGRRDRGAFRREGPRARRDRELQHRHGGSGRRLSRRPGALRAPRRAQRQAVADPRRVLPGPLGLPRAVLPRRGQHRLHRPRGRPRHGPCAPRPGIAARRGRAGGRVLAHGSHHRGSSRPAVPHRPDQVLRRSPARRGGAGLPRRGARAHGRLDAFRHGSPPGGAGVGTRRGLGGSTVREQRAHAPGLAVPRVQRLRRDHRRRVLRCARRLAFHRLALLRLAGVSERRGAGAIPCLEPARAARLALGSDRDQGRCATVDVEARLR